MNTSTSTESSKQQGNAKTSNSTKSAKQQGNAKVEPATNYDFSEIPEAKGHEDQKIPIASINKADLPLNPSPPAQQAALNSEPEEEISNQVPAKRTYRKQKQGRKKARSTLLLALFYRIPKVKKRGRGRKKRKKPVKWADLREKFVKAIRYVGRCALAGIKPTIGIFSHSPDIKKIWRNIELLIDENQPQFEELLKKFSFTNITDPIFRDLYKQDIWKKLHYECMRLLFSDKEPISLDVIARLSTELNLHCYPSDHSPAQRWMELKEFLLKEVMQDEDFKHYHYADSVIAE